MGIVSQRLRDSAKGQECTLHFRCCNGDCETTVLAHLPSIVKGMGNKSHDFNAAFACSECHSYLDNHRSASMSEEYAHCYMGLRDTLQFWIENGYIEIVGDKEPKPRPQSKKSLPRKLSWQAR